jgi:DnaJ-class molecular chaperone
MTMNKIMRTEDTKVFVCPNCGGTKKVEDKECSVCEGSGVVLKSAPSPKVGDSFTKLEDYV